MKTIQVGKKLSNGAVVISALQQLGVGGVVLAKREKKYTCEYVTWILDDDNNTCSGNYFGGFYMEADEDRAYHDAIKDFRKRVNSEILK